MELTQLEKIKLKILLENSIRETNNRIALLDIKVVSDRMAETVLVYRDILAKLDK